VSQAYDNAGRVLSTTTSISATPRTVGYGWDADGNRQSMTYPNMSVISYVNDGLDRMQNILDQNNAVLATYVYDALGRRLSLTRGNGTATGYSYDGASRLHVLSQTAPPAYSAQNVDFTLDYNPASQITGRTVSNDSYVYALTSGSTAYASNGKNQMVQAGSAVPTWDRKGNLTSDGTNTYTYSSENLLTHVVNPGGNYSTASSPVYDPLGRLQGTGSNYDGYQAELVEDLAGQVVFEYATRSRTRRYVFGPEPDEVLVQYFTYYPAPQYNSRTWYQSDERGSIASMTGDTGSGGTPNRYDEYGVPAASNFGRFQYTGQFWLAEPSLYYYKARFYDPKLGLFLQTDPKGYDAGANLYAYVGDDPMNEDDPDGTEFRSHWLLRLLVPGQIAWDEAVNAYQRGQYVEAAGHAANMLGEQVLTVASAGTGSAATRAASSGVRVAMKARPATSAVQRILLQRDLAVREGLGALKEGGGSIIAGPGSPKNAVFRQAEMYAREYGGKAADYVKVSSSHLTADKQIVSVHAVRNTVTGALYDAKTLIGR
jgi:RHS repeat-associated protein